ncbi:MAG: nucleotide exchange factor GrpE [Cryomorphaceae bacterium]|nr:nucleotide exchange factor GrpE [Cryomorphaceae bacterium]|tara:strand:+ start:7247 stop:7789 length:543 start_codon:yes stop_codon:yes gene_type:complete
MGKSKKKSDPKDLEKSLDEQDSINDSINEDSSELSLEDQFNELKDQNLRLYAEFENFRKRNARERLDLMSTASEKVIKAILPVIDDFERALKSFPKDSEELVGLDLIYSKLKNVLKSEGLSPLESTIGSELDVETMEAITTIPAVSDDQKGTVVDEIEKGYRLGSKIIRFAKVVVADSNN